MSERLTDEELDALIARFSPGRHPKVAAALAELVHLRADGRHRIRQSTSTSASSKTEQFVMFSCACGWSVELPTGTKSHVCELCGTTAEAE